MSYRESADVHPEIDGVPTHTKIRLLNGTTSELIITCSYVIPAVAPSTEDTYEPIHLLAEGYSDPVVAFSPAIEGLSGAATIAIEDDGVVNVVFTLECPSAVLVDADCSVSVLASRGTGPTKRTDCILRGALEIEDAPLPAVVP